MDIKNEIMTLIISNYIFYTLRQIACRSCFCCLLFLVFVLPLSYLKDTQAKTLFLTTLEAERGDIGAQYELGIRYFYGQDVKRDAELGLQWLETAASNRSIRAFNRLGFLYLNGAGVRKNEKKALGYFEKSAHENNPEGQFNLAYLYQNGIGTAVDLSRAFQWYMLAAEQDFAEAQYNVGLMLMRGEGVIRDIIAGIDWLKKAGSIGFGKAYHAIGILFYSDLPNVPRHLDSSRLYFYKAIENNYKPSGVNLGMMHTNGLGGAQNHITALALLKWSESEDTFVKEKIYELEAQLNAQQEQQADQLYLALRNQQFNVLLQ